MRIICNSEKNISKLWGEGKAKYTYYRLLTYIVDTDVDGGSLLHNTVTGELIFLNNDEMKQISSLPCRYDPWMEELIKDHYLVPVEQNDKTVVDYLRAVGRSMYYANTKHIWHYIIFPTTNCNARCFYCFEHGKCDFIYENMSDETADRLVYFIEKNHGEHPVRIIWFGGEPLVGIRQIDRISTSLKELGIEFSSEMVSNSYLFTEEIVKRAKKEWNLEKVQITLDGTEKVYNEVKNYKNPCANPFQRVLNNIDYLIENGISVLILLNLGLHNAEDLIHLADELTNRFPNKENIMVCSQKLYESCGSIPTQYSEEEYAFLENKENELNKHLSSFKKTTCGRASMPCMGFIHCTADGSNSVVVTPSGKITKCMHYVSDHFVGDLNMGVVNTEEIKLFQKQKVYPQCAGCKLYPACFDLQMCEKTTTCREVDVRTKTKNFQGRSKSCYEEFLRNETAVKQR